MEWFISPCEKGLAVILKRYYPYHAVASQYSNGNAPLLWTPVVLGVCNSWSPYPQSLAPWLSAAQGSAPRPTSLCNNWVRSGPCLTMPCMTKVIIIVCFYWNEPFLKLSFFFFLFKETTFISHLACSSQEATWFMYPVELSPWIPRTRLRGRDHSYVRDPD